MAKAAIYLELEHREATSRQMEAALSRFKTNLLNLGYTVVSEDTMWGDTASPTSESSPDEPTAAPIDPGTFSNAKLEAHLASNDYTLAELEAIADAEAAGKARVGAMNAIEAAIKEV